MAIKISELTATTAPNAASEIAIAYGGSSYKVQISDLLSTTSAAYTSTIGFLGDSSANAVEGGQIYFALPSINKSELNSDKEGNGWNIDCYKDANGIYIANGLNASGPNHMYLRIFSPISRAGGVFTPLLINARGGLASNGLTNRHYGDTTYARGSASKGDVILQPNTGGTITEGQAFTATVATSNFHGYGMTAGRNAGIRLTTLYSGPAAGNVSNETTARLPIRDTDIFNEGNGGALHITKPNKSSNSTILTLTIDGVLNTLGGGTSDERVKKDIESLSEAEKNVALKIKANMKKFRRIDQIESGEKLKIGAIAQEVEQFFNEEGLDYKDYSIIHTEKRYALFEGDKIIKHELPSDIENTEVEEQKSKTQVILKDGTEYIGTVTNWFCAEECEECKNHGMSEEEYRNTKICIHINDDEYEVVAREDVASQKVLPPEGWVEVDFFRIDYDQLLAFIISAL